jgi:hypothetical protein
MRYDKTCEVRTENMKLIVYAVYLFIHDLRVAWVDVLQPAVIMMSGWAKRNTRFRYAFRSF